MKKLISLLPGVVLSLSPIVAQNLVPNSSFENNTGCPSGWSQIGLVNQWTSPSNGTPDYYHTCATVPDMDVPVNISGYAQPHTGNGYVGIITYGDTLTFPGTPLYVEYIQIPLSSPMIAGQCYTVQFWVSCCEGTPALIGTDPNIVGLSSHISAFISVAPPTAPGWNGILPIPGVPQITSSVTVNDTSIWTLVTGTYTAAGGEQFITIGNWDMGNFGNGPPNSVSMFEPSIAYYFIDDVEITPLSPLSLGVDLPFCPGDQITLTANAGATSYLWSTMETTSSITVSASGIYWVQQISGSCTQTDTIEIYDDNCVTPPATSCTFFIPNSFTPNNNGTNDKFGGVGENVAEFHIMIFNRWGEMIFESYDMNDHWNGRFHDQLVEEGVYVYYLDFRCDGEFVRRNGHVALIR